MKWNREEFVVGCLMGGAFFLILKLFTFLVAPLCGLFWMLGGQYGEYWRKVGVPTILCIALALVTHNWWVLLSWPFAFGTTCLGYGIPSFDSNGVMTDEGSDLGNFMYFHVCNKNELWADILTRGTIGLAMMVSFLPLAWINLPAYLLGGILMVIGFPTIVRLVP